MRSPNLGLAFVLELCLFAALVYWSVHLDASTVLRWVVDAGGSAALALTWALVAAPTAKRPLRRAPLIGFKLLVFTVGVGLLYAAGRHVLATAFEALVLISPRATAALGRCFNARKTFRRNGQVRWVSPGRMRPLSYA